MKSEKSIMQQEGIGANCFILGHKCYRCGHAWVPREKGYVPEVCPSCKSPYWKSEKVKKSKKEKKKK